MVILGRICCCAQLEPNKSKRQTNKCKNALFHNFYDTFTFEILDDFWHNGEHEPPEAAAAGLRMRTYETGCLLLAPRSGLTRNSCRPPSAQYKPCLTSW